MQPLTYFSISNQDTFEKIQGGEIGFYTRPRIREHHNLNFVQRFLFREAAEDAKAYHVFIIVSKVSETEITIADASGKGLKQRKISLKHIQENKEEMVLFRVENTRIRERMIANALRDVDLLPKAEGKNPEEYAMAMTTHHSQPNGLYDRKAYWTSFLPHQTTLSASWDELIWATVDCIHEDFIRDSNDQRKKFICSSFAALIYQVSTLEICLQDHAPEVIERMKSTSLWDANTILHNYFAEHPAVLNQCHLLPSNFKWQTPASLKRELGHLAAPLN